MKLELVLPPLLTAVTLIAVILVSLRRGLRESRQLTLELESRAKAHFDELMRDSRAEVARIEAEKVARAAGFDLVLTLDAGADAEVVFDRAVDFLNELGEYARVSGGTGLAVDPAHSRAEPGTVTLRLVPTDPRYVAKQREVVAAQTRKLAGVSEVELVAA